MKKTLSTIDCLNLFSLKEYLALIGIEPTHERSDSTDYQVQLDGDSPTFITVDHDKNHFTEPARNRKGYLVDFACLLFGCTPEDLCGNIARYRIDLLMQQAFQRPAA